MQIYLQLRGILKKECSPLGPTKPGIIFRILYVSLITNCYTQVRVRDEQMQSGPHSLPARARLTDGPADGDTFF